MYINPNLIHKKDDVNENGTAVHTIHINPAFQHAKSNVYVNPRFFQRFKDSQKNSVTTMNTLITRCETKSNNEVQNNFNVNKTCSVQSKNGSSGNKFKYLRVPNAVECEVSKPRNSTLPASQSAVAPSNLRNPYKLVNKSCHSNLSTATCSKYLKSPIKKKFKPKSKFKLVNAVKNTFKLDKRVKIKGKPKNILLNSKSFKIENLFPKSVGVINNYKLDRLRSSPTNPIASKSSVRETKNRKKVFQHKKLISIGGILYKATSKSLTRTSNKSSGSSKQKITNFPSTRSNKVQRRNRGTKLQNSHVLNIRGENFVLSRNGKTLRRVPGQKEVTCPKQRVDFGGVTFRQASDNVLVRTESHRARSLLIQARQKSIACLTARHRKNNIPCLIFQKLGHCRRLERGICSYTHDPKNVALCKRFLSGNCTDVKCLLSHQVVPEKMATCHFFLEGTCVRENCPYLHVKVSQKASVCVAFLQGYCHLGQECNKRHVNVCPVYDKLGFCKKGNNCPYPHSKTGKRTKLDRKKNTWKPAKKSNASPKSANKKKRKRDLPKNDEEHESGSRYYVAGQQSSSTDVVLPKRKRLNTLPSFIAIDPLD